MEISHILSRTVFYLTYSQPTDAVVRPTAVLKVVADLLTAADRGEVTFLSLLDLSAAFDNVDHDILIDRLYHAFGFRDQVLSWITSFITGRTQRVRVGGQYSTNSAVHYGVPLGAY